MDNSERIKALYEKKLAKGKSGNRSTKGSHNFKVDVGTRPVRPAKIELITKIPGLARNLFPYQLAGVSFVEHRKGKAIVGDDMGLGKTAQALAYLQLHPEDRPALVVCPSSLKLNWAKEIFMWTQKRKENLVYMLSGKVKKSIEEVWMTGSGRLIMTPEMMPEKGIFIINYDVIKEWAPELLKRNFKIMILDEAQYCKSKAAKRTKAIDKLSKKIPKLLALTGTLIENRPAEAFSVIRMVDRTLFPLELDFKYRYCDPVKTIFGWEFKGSSNIAELHQKLKAIMIRRLKADVLPELPKKMRVVIPIEMESPSVYKYAEDNFITWLKENKGKEKAEQASKIIGLAKLNELKQLCMEQKFESCLNWIEDYLSNGSKLVVFAVNTWVINRIEDEFKDYCVKIDGSVTGEDRNEAVEQFQKNPKVKLLVGQLKAAGVGLTLTAANAVCFVQLGWNPSEMMQAEDRCHRIGQESDNVTAYYLLANNTIEIDISTIIDAKAKVVNAVLDGIDTNESDSLINKLFESLAL